MKTEELRTSQPKGATGKLVTATVATALWILAAIWVGWSAEPPIDLPDCTGTFSCLSANEWGDYLAGVFAPVAFLWLVVTAWIQSDELREQRRELQETRNVLTEQAKEAKRQAEYIQQQTILLSEEAASRRQEANSLSFFVLTNKYIEYAKETAGMCFVRSGLFTAHLTMPPDSNYSEDRFIEFQLDHIRKTIDGLDTTLEVTRPDIFERLYIYAYSAEELVDLLPYHSRVTWNRSKLDKLLDTYAHIIRKCPELNHLRDHVQSRENRRMNA